MPAAAEQPAAGALPIRGVVRAVEQATISTDLEAVVDRLGFRAGERFQRGDLLIGFDCRRYEAQLAGAEAAEREMRAALQASEYLRARGAGSRQDRDIAQARVDKAGAEVAGLRAVIDHCEIRAPFAGRIDEQQIHAHEMAGAGRPLLSILSTERLEVELILPSGWLTWLRAGSAFDFRIDERGRAYRGRIVRLGASVDAISQTVKVTGVLEDGDADILPGMSGEAAFAGYGG